MTAFADGTKQQALNDLRLELEAQVKGKRCTGCHSDVWPAWYEGTWQLRCREGFGPEIERRPNHVAERLGKMIQRYETRVDGMMEPVQAPSYLPEHRTMTIQEFKERQDLIKYVVSEMQENVHYGQIPGTRDKSLWEPGAEYLRAAFNIQWGYELVDELEDYETGDFRYRFFVFHLLGPGIRGPGWEASAWSKERKFWCRGGKNGCSPNCLQDHEPSMERQMLPHNVRDRALKRGFVALIRNVTGTTGYFKGELDVSSESVASNNGVDPDQHPWLVTCPEHNKDWFRSGNMREPAHKQGNDWCNQSKVLKPLIDSELEKVITDSWDRNELNTWLKHNFDGKTWSQLSPRRQLEAIDRLKTTPPPSATGSQEETPQTDGSQDAPEHPVPESQDDLPF